jgi:hypothetical protein
VAAMKTFRCLAPATRSNDSTDSDTALRSHQMSAVVSENASNPLRLPPSRSLPSLGERYLTD